VHPRSEKPDYIHVQFVIWMFTKSCKLPMDFYNKSQKHVIYEYDY